MQRVPSQYTCIAVDAQITEERHCAINAVSINGHGPTMLIARIRQSITQSKHITQHRNVLDEQTDRQTDKRTTYNRTLYSFSREDAVKIKEMNLKSRSRVDRNVWGNKASVLLLLLLQSLR